MTDLAHFGDYYRVLAEIAEDHLFVIDSEDRVEYVNPAAARQHRTTPEQLIGRRRVEIFPPDVAERQGGNLQRVFQTGKPLYVEARNTYGGAEVWLSTWLAPIPDGHGGVRAVLGVSRDMTARKRAEDELRASEQRQSVVLSNVPLVLWATDRGGTTTFCAGRMLEQAGISAGDIVGTPFGRIDVNPFPALRDMLTRALAGEDASTQISVGEQAFETWSSPLRDGRGEIAGATGVVVDVTERLKLEVELSNAQKLEALGRLAGGIAHDFNNNLTAILGYIDLLTEQLGAEAPIGRDLGEVRHAAMSAAGLVRRLLAFGRRQVLQPRSLDLNAIVHGIRPILERLLGEHIRIDVSAAQDLQAVTADASELEQVIMNLALNARDAMPEGGTLTIETANAGLPSDRRPAMPDGHYVLLRIRDTGAGMAPHVKQRVFEPFFTTKPAGEGTGLGLSAVYGIVKQLGGFIWVDSAVGRGSTFHVYLPATTAAVYEPPAAESARAPSSVQPRLTVLLVEDEDIVRRFTKRALEQRDFHVLEAATPEEALSIAGATDSIALLLTDVVMPRMSGPELAARIRRARPALPVLYMSGYPENLVLPGRTLDPSVRLLSKPFTSVQLVEMIQRVLAAEVQRS